MIIKRNERRRGNARRIIIILSWGFPFAPAHLPPHPSASLHFPSPFSAPLPARPTPRVSVRLPAAPSSSTEPAAPLFTPTNGGSFCFTFVLISDEREDPCEWPRYASAAAPSPPLQDLEFPCSVLARTRGRGRKFMWRLEYLGYFHFSDCLATRSFLFRGSATRANNSPLLLFASRDRTKLTGNCSILMQSLS